MASHLATTTMRRPKEVRVAQSTVSRAKRAAAAYFGLVLSLGGCLLLGLVVATWVAAGVFVLSAGLVVYHFHPRTEPIRARRRYYGGHRKADGGLQAPR